MNGKIPPTWVVVMIIYSFPLSGRWGTDLLSVGTSTAITPRINELRSIYVFTMAGRHRLKRCTHKEPPHLHGCLHLIYCVFLQHPSGGLL